MIHKVFINGGGSSPYDQIALVNGWKLGASSGHHNSPKPSLFMVDNHWQKYDHKTHLSFIKKARPHLATLRDIESSTDQVEVYDHAQEILLCSDRAILIPKCHVGSNLMQLPNLILGLPVGRSENPISWGYAKESNYPVHLLGGSPKHWLRGINELGLSRIYSLDGNYLSKIAQWGKIYKDWRSRSPYPWEVEDGEGFNYRCFAHSIQWVNSTLLEQPRQLGIL